MPSRLVRKQVSDRERVVNRRARGTAGIFSRHPASVLASWGGSSPSAIALPHEIVRSGTREESTGGNSASEAAVEVNAL